MSPSILDTDTVSFLLKGHPQVVSHMEAYWRTVGSPQVSVLTQYEILKGLAWRRAERRRQRFNALLAAWTVLPVVPQVAARAASLYGDQRRRGRTRPDIDLLIAATALWHGLAVITHNVRHYSGIEGLSVMDWTRVDPPAQGALK
jgi:tRNA(fMet)-specific endonuclease VapC